MVSRGRASAATLNAVMLLAIVTLAGCRLTTTPGAGDLRQEFANTWIHVDDRGYGALVGAEVPSPIQLPAWPSTAKITGTRLIWMHLGVEGSAMGAEDQCWLPLAIPAQVQSKLLSASHLTAGPDALQFRVLRVSFARRGGVLVARSASPVGLEDQRALEDLRAVSPPELRGRSLDTSPSPQVIVRLLGESSGSSVASLPAGSGAPLTVLRARTGGIGETSDATSTRGLAGLLQTGSEESTCGVADFVVRLVCWSPSSIVVSGGRVTTIGDRMHLVNTRPLVSRFPPFSGTRATLVVRREQGLTVLYGWHYSD